MRSTDIVHQPLMAAPGSPWNIAAGTRCLPTSSTGSARSNDGDGPASSAGSASGHSGDHHAACEAVLRPVPRQRSTDEVP
ncbi:MAG: hypothetical protein E6J36_21940, partial [Chloroflexi bacterium]